MWEYILRNFEWIRCTLQYKTISYILDDIVFFQFRNIMPFTLIMIYSMYFLHIKIGRGKWPHLGLLRMVFVSRTSLIKTWRTVQPKVLAKNLADNCSHDDVIKWKHFPRYWPFVRGIHRSPMNPPHKAQWRGASIFSLVSAWTVVQTIETPAIWDTIALIMMSL